MKGKSASLISGIMLILFGAALLLNKWDIITFTWFEAYPLILLAISFYSITSVLRGNKDAAFWATFTGVIGLYFFLRNYDIFLFFWDIDIWAVLIFSLGIAFIALYFIKSYDWGLLIPGGIFVLIGSIFIAYNLGLGWITMEVIYKGWPLILVIIGLGLVLNSLSKRNKKISD